MSTTQKIVICVIIALWCFAPAVKIDTNTVDISFEETEAYGYAGLFAYSDNVDEVVKPDDVPVAECKCNKSTGLISYDGGGSLTACPCKNGECKCGCVNCKTKASGDAVGDVGEVLIKKEGIRMILVTDPVNCVPCRQLDTGLLKILKDDAHKKAGWVLNNTEQATVQILALGNKDDEAEIERLGLDIAVVPSFIRFNSDDENLVGNVSEEEFLKFFYGGDKVPFYTQRTSMNWKINGSLNPHKKDAIKHLRSDKDHSSVHSWPLEVLSVKDLISLHSDLHNGNAGVIEWREK